MSSLESECVLSFRFVGSEGRSAWRKGHVTSSFYPLRTSQQRKIFIEKLVYLYTGKNQYNGPVLLMKINVKGFVVAVSLLSELLAL